MVEKNRESYSTVFLGTPEFAAYHLQSLLEDSPLRICGVVSQPDRKRGRKMQTQASPVKELALKNNIEVITPERFNKEVLDYIFSWKPKVAIVVAFGQILPQSFLDLFSGRAVNVHGSLLPRWRGAAPIQRALMNGDKISGVALQVMVKELDAGDIIGQRELALGSEMNAIELHDYLKVLGVDLLKNELIAYLRGEIEAQPQNPTNVTYANKIHKSESHINWENCAKKIHNTSRGMALGPGVHTLFRGKKLKIHQARVDADFVFKEGKDIIPGQVVDIGSDSGGNANFFLVACGQGRVLRVLEVQQESRMRMSVREFLRGAEMTVGEVLL